VSERKEESQNNANKKAKHVKVARPTEVVNDTPPDPQSSAATVQTG